MATNFTLTPAQAAVYDENQQPQFYAALVICTVLVLLLYFLRLWSQSITRTLTTPDMYLITIALVWLLALNITNFVAIGLGGGGKHAWRIVIENNGKPDGLINFQKAGYCVTITLIPAYVFVKLSMLAFFRRIFSAQDNIFRAAWWILLILNIIYLIAVFFELVFQCWPISWFWERALLAYINLGFKAPYELTPGSCLPQISHTVVPLISGLILDVALLLLPLVPVWKLQLSMIKKIGLLVTLSIGIFAIVLDGIRIYYDYQVVNGVDASWVNMPVLLWCSIQVSAGFVCACIPACAPLVRSRLRNRTTLQQYQVPGAASNRLDVSKGRSRGLDRSISSQNLRECSSDGTSKEEMDSFPMDSFPMDSVTYTNVIGQANSSRKEHDDTPSSGYKAQGGIRVTNDIEVHRH